MSESADSLSAMPVLEPLEHSVLEVPLKVGNGAIDKAPVPNPSEYAV